MSLERPLVTVLYEDKRGPTKVFGPHVLAVGCVHDVVDGDRFSLERRIEGRQMNGDNKVLRAVREDAARIAAFGQPLIALFDNDKVRRLLKLPAACDAEKVVVAVLEGCTLAKDRVDVILLDKNVESLLRAALECERKLGNHASAEAQPRIDKDRAARDERLVRIGRLPHRGVRDCVLGIMPSFKGLVDAIVRRLAPPPTPLPSGSAPPVA